MTGTVALGSVIGVLLLAAVLWRPNRKPERYVPAFLLFYAALGAYTLGYGFLAAPGQEPATFVYWKPTVLFWGLALIQIAGPLLGWGYPFKVVFGTFFVLSDSAWRWTNYASAALFVVMGTANLLVAFNLSEGNWDGFKYSCRVLLMFLILLRLNFVWLDLVSRIVIGAYRRVRAWLA